MRIESPPSSSLQSQSLPWIIRLVLVLIAVLPGALEFIQRNNRQAFVATALETHGTVLARLAHNHNFVRYEYSVGRRMFRAEGEDRSCGRETQVGATIPVLYRADRPAVSVTGTPRCFIGGFGSVVAAAMVGLVAAAVLFVVLSVTGQKSTP